ncbi:hypothetical protein [Clostridium sartagoforme]|uniref:hypothetical protein n=1 Tax=Clostridium sartagoforme TaxID=84031 RepID=UPI0003A37B66|nr:hypothetical protein [Clostridium sartagoforme]
MVENWSKYIKAKAITPNNPSKSKVKSIPTFMVKVPAMVGTIIDDRPVNILIAIN